MATPLKSEMLAVLALTALTCIEHDGVKFGPGQDAGEDFEATEAQARPLIAVGAAKLKEVAVAADGEAGGGKTVVSIKGKGK